MNDKTKLIIVVVLFVVLATVGVFQLTRSSAPAPTPPPPTRAQHDPTSGTVSADSHGTPNSGVPNQGPGVSQPTTPAATSLPAPAGKDPVTAAGVVGKLGPGVVGAASRLPATQTTADASSNESLQTPVATLATLTPFPDRDPFRPVEMPPSTQAASATAAPPRAATKTPPTPQAKSGNRNNIIPPLGVIPGTLPSGSPEEPGKLTGSVNGVGNGGAVATFAYALEGIILGPHTAAVFVDSAGNERLVPLGGALDGDTRLVKVEGGRVTVRFHGKELRLTPGGNDSGN